MPQRISDIFQISPKLLKEHNVYNGFVDIDSELYVDPRLLPHTSVEELKGTDQTVLNFFDTVLRNILEFLEYQNECEERTLKKDEIIESLKFPEIPLTGLGYSINHNSGRGIGVILATNLSTTVIDIVRKGIKDPIIFELAEVFEQKYGPDRISDMILWILLSDLVQFSCRIAKDLNLPTSKKSTLIGGETYNNLPCCPTQINVNPGQGFLLVPEDILTSLPVARSWEERERVTIHNHELRNYINKKITKYTYLSPSYRKLVKNKILFREVVLQHPEIMRDFIKKYKAKEAKSYDFKNDPNDVFKWHDTARNYAERFPLKITHSSGKGFLNNEEIVEKICEHFRELVNLGLDSAFYRPGREPKKEEKGQLILLELLEQYLTGSPLIVKYAPKEKVINLCYSNSYIAYRIILKFTSTPGINNSYDAVIENIYSNFQGLYNILFLIEVDRGKTIQDIVTQSNIQPLINESKFFKRHYIYATSRF